MSKPPFFFDPEPENEPQPSPTDSVGDGSFFNALQDAGIVQQANDLVPVQIEGKMQEKNGPFVHLEYGIYREDYSLHITPTHETRNFSSPHRVELAVVEVLKLIKPEIPDSMRIDVYLPREEWKVKVISIVMRGAAKDWGFTIKDFEAAVIEAIYDRVQAVVTAR